jgi:hypothetical protein
MKKLLSILLATLAMSTAHGADVTGVDTPETIVFNEIMASNAGMVYSPAINFDSWVEVYNPTAKAVNLSGMFLSNDATNLKLWKMPSDIGTIPAGGFLVIWLGSDDIKSNQAPFKLDCDGGTICLSDKNGQLVTSMNYPAAMSRTAYACTADGNNTWQWTAYPTPGATNATSAFASERLAAPVVSHGSQLFKGTLNVTVNIPAGATLMYTTDGSLPQPPQPETGEEKPQWTDLIVNGDCEGADASCLISRDADGDDDEARIVDGAGIDGSRGIKIHSTANAAEDWSAQFFVYTPGHVWQSGESYRFTMMVRADKKARITSQTHAAPHDYIYGLIGTGSYDVTTEWSPITIEGTITDEQTGSGYDWWTGQTTAGRMQTIAFNLNVDRKDNNYYFDNVSWELFVGDGHQVEASQKSEDGKFTISNTTNLTVRLFQDGYLPSVPVTRSYIKTSNNYTLPVISIVGDKSFFTDPKTGIDCDGDGTNGKTGNGQDWPRNYNQDWDRPVNFSYIGTDGTMRFNQDVNISVSGGWTRSQRFRSFKLKSNKVFDGQNRFDYSFFPQKPYIRNKALLVRNGGNDIWVHNARFVDPALETIIQRSGLDVDVQSYVPIIEYVNGELRGVLNLREPNNDKYAYANWGYDDEELDAFENETIKNGDDVVLNRIYELGRNINDEGAYDELKTLLDVDEFTNYMAVTLYLFNDDWPNNNIKGYRSRNDGRYRFVSFDLDYAFAGCRSDSKDDPFAWFASFKNSGDLNQEFVRLFLNLLGHDEYRRKFIDTFCLVAGSVFEPTRAGKIVDELLNNVQAMCQLMKQQGINDGHDPDRAATTIKNNLKGRSQKMTGYLKNFSYAKLTNSAQSVTLKTNVEGARLFVNGIAVPYADFKGHLFAPVTLRAEAPAGYKFAGWKNGSTTVSTDEAMALPSGTVSLTATFTKLSDSEQASQGITPVRINEVSAANGIFTNDHFKRNDWVELYNTTDSDIDVQGMYISDNLSKPKKYQISKGNSLAQTVIPAHGYLVVWCDKLEPVSALHASFKLDADGGDVLLTAADESWSDRLSYTLMNSDQTVGRYPDGSNQIYVMNIPTIAKANATSSYVTDITGSNSTGISEIAYTNAATVSLQYAGDRLIIRSGLPQATVKLDICSVTGQSLTRQTVTMTGGYAEQDISQLPSGYYIARVSDSAGHATTCKFIKK